MDIFALQDDVARSILGQLQPELLQAERRRGVRTPTENLDAWTLLNSARMSFMMGHGRDALKEAARLAVAALEQDPDYAEAHAFLVELTLTEVATRWSDNPEEGNEQLAYHLRRAHEIDPENPFVLYCSAMANIYSANSEGAIEQIERCCAINPNDAFAQAQRGIILAFAGRAEEGLEATELALRLSPRDPRTYWLLLDKAIALLVLGHYGEAEQVLRQSIGLNNGFFWAWFTYIPTLSMQGKNAEATEAIKEIKRLSPDLERQDFEDMFRNFTGHSTGEHGALIDRQINSLRDIWPSG